MIARIPGVLRSGVWIPATAIPAGGSHVVFDGADYLVYDDREAAPALHKPAGDPRTPAQFSLDMAAALAVDKARSIPAIIDWHPVPKGAELLSWGGHSFFRQIPDRPGCLSVNGDGTAYRFEVAPRDICLAIDGPAAVVERCELSCLTKLVPLTTYRVSYSLLIDLPYGAPSNWVVIGQLHQTEDPADKGISPLFAREITLDRRLSYVRRTSRSDPNAGNLPANYSPVEPRWGSWVRVVEHHRIDPLTSAGIHRVWHDGTQVLDYSGPTGYVDAAGPYYKPGIYRAADPLTTLAVQVANFDLRTL